MTAPAADASPASAPAAVNAPSPSAPEPTPTDPQPTAPQAAEPVVLGGPVDILPGGRSRRPRRGLFGQRPPAGGSVPPPRTPAASIPAHGAAASRTAHPPAPQPTGSATGGTDDGAAPASEDELRQRSLLASEALSELSRLSTYSPSAVEGTDRRTPLTRRQPAAVGAVSPEAEESLATDSATAPAVAPGLPSRRPASATTPLVAAPSGPPRERSADQVRQLISGFNSGASRGGRAGAGVLTPSSPAAAGPAPTDAGPTSGDIH